MSTIQKMINYNKKFKNKNFSSILSFINDLDESKYSKNDQRIIHNTILNILNKKDVSSGEVNILKSIINKLSKNSNTRNTSTIFFLINELYSDLFKRKYELEGDLNELKALLNNINNNQIKILLDIFEKSKNNVVNITKYNSDTNKYFTASNGALGHIIGYYTTDTNKIKVIFYGREKLSTGDYKSFLQSIFLEEIPKFYSPINIDKIKSNGKEIEKFSLIKSVSGKSPQIEREGDKYKIKLKNGSTKQIYTKLEKNSSGKYQISVPLQPLSKNNVKKNNIKPVIS